MTIAMFHRKGARDGYRSRVRGPGRHKASAWRCQCGEFVPNRLEECRKCGGEREDGIVREWTEDDAIRASDATEVQ